MIFIVIFLLLYNWYIVYEYKKLEKKYFNLSLDKYIDSYKYKD